MTKENTSNLIDFLTNVNNRISGIENGSENIAEVLLNEPAETPAEIAELEAITDDEDESDTKKSEMDFVIGGGRIGNIHANHINANENREKNK